MSAVLECTALTSGYKGIPAVRDLDLAVRAGEIVAILGPNGAGKTTTLLTLAGVLQPISGEVTALGEPVRGGRPHLSARRGISLVPDDRALIFGLTVRENLTIALPRKRKAAAVDRVLDHFGALRSKLDVPAGRLSGGEQQMLTIGRAVAREAKVLMIDEMSLGLAPVIAKSILPILRGAVDEYGTAVVLVEQHVDLALSVADRALVLNRGRVTVSGTAAELRGRRDLLQASYLGEVADVPAELSADGGRWLDSTKESA